MMEKIWVCDDEPSARYPVWTRGNVGETFIEAVSPLTWSIFGVNAWEPGWRDAFGDMGVFTAEDFRPPGECEVVGCFGGYIYINMSVTRVMAVRVPGLTVEAMDHSLFGDHPGAPPYRPDPRDRNPECTTAAGAWLASLFATDPMLPTDRDRARLDALIAARPDFQALSDAQLLGYVRSLTTEGRQLFRRHVLNTYGGNVLNSLIAQTAAAAGVGDLAARVVAAVGDVDSAVQAFELWAISREVRSSVEVSAAFDAGIEGLLVRLRASRTPEATHFCAAWDAFIARWGFLGLSVWEIRSPTYGAEPEIALRMLDRARQAPDSASPDARLAERIAEREAAVAAIAGRLAGDEAARGQFLGAAGVVGRYMAARERSKGQCARLIDEARGALRTLGGRLVRRGLLPRWEHVLLVTDAEADAFLADPAAHRDRTTARAARLDMLMAKSPPFVFEGDPPPLSAFADRVDVSPDRAEAGLRLAGIGVSPGVRTGRARVIASLCVDSRLEPGDIIVAVTTDSSWGPLYLAAGGVIVETGAAISHAAIVSRELGIPAVASVTDATRYIRDGSLVTIDGSSGTVVVH